MSRLPRIAPLDIPQHIIQRGNNRQICFAVDKDRIMYTKWLMLYAREFKVDIHAWVFMSNHVHLLATPRISRGISLMMQALGRRYVRYFNYCHERTGTLWEGRFRSSLVQSEHYLLQCQRYIELNPVRAGMANVPGNYYWSSYHCHAYGVEAKLHTPHREYLALGPNTAKRTLRYRAWLEVGPDDVTNRDIRTAVNKGLAFGDDKFKVEIETLCGRRLMPCKMGRPLLLPH